MISIITILNHWQHACLFDWICPSIHIALAGTATCRGHVAVDAHGARCIHVPVLRFPEHDNRLGPEASGLCPFSLELEPVEAGQRVVPGQALYTSL